MMLIYILIDIYIYNSQEWFICRVVKIILFSNCALSKCVFIIGKKNGRQWIFLESKIPKGKKDKDKEKLFGKTFEAGHEHKATPAPAFWHMLACYYFFIFFLSFEWNTSKN